MWCNDGKKLESFVKTSCWREIESKTIIIFERKASQFLYNYRFMELREVKYVLQLTIWKGTVWNVQLSKTVSYVFRDLTSGELVAINVIAQDTNYYHNHFMILSTHAPSACSTVCCMYNTQSFLNHFSVMRDRELLVQRRIRERRDVEKSASENLWPEAGGINIPNFVADGHNFLNLLYLNGRNKRVFVIIIQSLFLHLVTLITEICICW